MEQQRIPYVAPNGDTRTYGPAYTVQWETVAGIGLVTVCVAGLIYVVANDVTIIGVIDDSLIGPLGAGVGEGIILIFQ